jgi:hypothetical protein
MVVLLSFATSTSQTGHRTGVTAGVEAMFGSKLYQAILVYTNLHVEALSKQGAASVGKAKAREAAKARMY